MCRSVTESTMLVASSRMMILGFLRIARAIDIFKGQPGLKSWAWGFTLCSSPPDSFTADSPTLVSYLSGNERIFSWISTALQAAKTSETA